MPKERFHLFIADRYLKTYEKTIPSALQNQSAAFLLGALSADIFYYDLPFLAETPLGDALHVLFEEDGIEPVRNWLVSTLCVQRSDKGSPSCERKLAWGLGLACHILTDALWHPEIDRQSHHLEFCQDKGLGFLDCHRLIESEHEALWLGQSKASDTYTNILRSFRKQRDWLREMASFYREFLDSAGLKPPTEEKVQKCYRDQNFLLRLFANRRLGMRRNIILDFPPTRFIGALITPTHPVLPAIFSNKFPPQANLFSAQFLEKAFISLAAPLTELSEQLSPCLRG
jgi:hypothetical protein